MTSHMLIVWKYLALALMNLWRSCYASEYFLTIWYRERPLHNIFTCVTNSYMHSPEGHVFLDSLNLVLDLFEFWLKYWLYQSSSMWLELWLLQARIEPRPIWHHSKTLPRRPSAHGEREFFASYIWYISITGYQ